MATSYVDSNTKDRSQSSYPNTDRYLDKFKDIVAILRAIKEDDGSISWSAEA